MPFPPGEKKKTICSELAYTYNYIASFKHVLGGKNYIHNVQAASPSTTGLFRLQAHKAVSADTPTLFPLATAPFCFALHAAGIEH